jgi:serine/threonine-protein kinase SRPK3
MNGADIKKAAINKAKQVAQAANGNNAGKKRRKGQDLKPIITTEKERKSQEASPASSTNSFNHVYVHSSASCLAVLTVLAAVLQVLVLALYKTRNPHTHML